MQFCVLPVLLLHTPKSRIPDQHLVQNKTL